MSGDDASARTALSATTLHSLRSASQTLCILGEMFSKTRWVSTGLGVMLFQPTSRRGGSSLSLMSRYTWGTSAPAVGPSFLTENTTDIELSTFFFTDRSEYESGDTTNRSQISKERAIFVASEEGTAREGIVRQSGCSRLMRLVLFISHEVHDECNDLLALSP